MRIPLLVCAASLILSGCVTATRAPCPSPTRCAPCPPSVPVETEAAYALFDGETGRPTTLDAFVRKARGADLVAFGELHGHPVGAAFELALLKRLGAGGRPVALAMEFFERDTQDELKDYLTGKLDKETFEKATKRPPAYAKTHAPLVDWQRTRRGWVIAANAPRRLVSGYRKSDLDYPAYRASLEPEDRALLPQSTSIVEDAYKDRFIAMMPGKMGETFFKSQALWDDAMAESMARFRSANQGHQVLFVVGGFHVTNGLGTITKYKQRRPGDRVAILLMDGVTEGSGDLEFADEDRGTADAVLKVVLQKQKPRGPNPHTKPKKMPEAKPETPENTTPPEPAAAQS